jgi:hypothetical protein
MTAAADGDARRVKEIVLSVTGWMGDIGAS